MASRRLTWPFSKFANVGELESTRAFSAAGRCQEPNARTFKVSHERLRAAVGRVDDHLPVGGASDLNTPVLQARAWRSAEPRGVRADVRGLGGEVKGLPGVEPQLSGLARDEEALAGGLERSMEGGEELERVFAKADEEDQRCRADEAHRHEARRCEFSLEPWLSYTSELNGL